MYIGKNRNTVVHFMQKNMTFAAYCFDFFCADDQQMYIVLK